MPPKRKQTTNTKDVDGEPNAKLKRTNGKADKEDEDKEVQSENKPKKKAGPKNKKQVEQVPEEMESNVATKQPVAKKRAAPTKKMTPDSEKNSDDEEVQPPKAAQKQEEQVQKEEPVNEDEEENGKAAAKPSRKRGAKAEKEENQSDKEVEETTEEDPKPTQKRGGRAKKEKKEIVEVAPTRTQPRRGKSKKEEEVVEEAPVPTQKRKVEAKKEEEELDDDDEEPAEAAKPAKRGAASKKPNGNAKAAKLTKTKAAPQNKTVTDWEHIDFSCKKQNPDGNDPNLKITSWNVDGIRAWIQKDGLEIFRHDNPDILCLQETKCSNDKLPDEVKKVEGYHAYWCPSEKEGYAGVATFTKTEPLSVSYGIGHENHDTEGRSLTLEFENFFLINVYVPNAGRGLVTLSKRLEWNNDFKAYVKELDEKKPVILCGDMNVSHNEIDLANPKSNKRNAGFTQEEREGMTEFLSDGYIDTFRNLYPDVKDVYTFWSYMSNARAKNVGWRLDYFIISERLEKKICDNVVRSEVFGSDHCPVSLFLNI